MAAASSLAERSSPSTTLFVARQWSDPCFPVFMSGQKLGGLRQR